MKEYIERAAVLKVLEEYYPGVDERLHIAKDITSIPTADVAEVRHGRWEKFVTASGIISRVRCSVCTGTQSLKFESMPYCPTCGARMDKEDEHEAG